MPKDVKMIRERTERLRKLIQYHRALYHTFDSPVISDAAFDSLKNELEELEYRHPDFVTVDSPTRTVGGEPLKEFTKAQHAVPMLSFNDAFSRVEMEEWFVRLKNYLGRSISEDFYCELKIDGLAIELTYEKGLLAKGSTRGDGRIGEDITPNIKTISGIPQHLEVLGDWPVPELVIARGEVYMSRREFERVNRESALRGEKPYANTRNLAAGSLRQLDPSITASRQLESFQYDLVEGVPDGIVTHEQKHKILASWGFRVNEHNRVKPSLKEVFRFRDQWQKKREDLDYDIDGIVVIANDLPVFEAGGVVGKAPRGAIAYKFSPKESTTVLKDIVIQVGRTGVLTPVAVLKPVELMGITIGSATLHNFDQIKKLDLRIGDTVVVSRAGDVIPRIIQALPELRTGKEKPYVAPDRCPQDNSSVVQDGVLYRCSNKQCGAQRLRQLHHFVSRSAMNIEGFGPKIIDRFVDKGLIADAADIFGLRKDEIAKLDRFGEKSAVNLIGEIEAKKTVSLARFLYALGILHIGEETTLILAEYMENQINNNQITIGSVVKHARNWSVEDLQGIRDIGPKVSRSIYDWFHNNKNIELLNKLEKAGVRITSSKKKAVNNKLIGKTFVFTGELQGMARGQAKEMVRQLGGEVSETVSAKTNYLVVGENPGSKLKMAMELGVTVLSEQDLLNLLLK